MQLTATTTGVARRVLDVALLALILLVLAVVVLARGIPAITGGATFVVGGGSMEPTIPLGAVVVATPVDAHDLAIGDVVSLQVGERHTIFTHRIVRTLERDGAIWLQTKGDANEKNDPSIVPATDVIGRVAFSAPYAGYVVHLLGTLQGVGFLVALGVLMLAGAWFLESIDIDQREAIRRRAAAGRTPILPEAPAGPGVLA